MKNKDIIALISKRRTQCLVFRYCYYVKANPLVSDQFYDKLERELKHLVEKYPELERKAQYAELVCPSRTVGSSNAEDYPRQIEQLAESLLANKDKYVQKS